MSQSLFFEPHVQFEKAAAEVALPEDANAWPTEVMQELFKQVPYVADFAPHVVMDRVDAERGFGFGHIEIQNRTEIQHGTSPEALHAAGVKSLRIPVIIKDRRLQPLDLLVTEDSKVMPLSEARLRQGLFRPQAFDITGRGPGDMSMIGQLYPPYRQNYGFGGGGATMSVGMGKEGGAAFDETAYLKSIYRDPSKVSAEDRARDIAWAKRHPETRASGSMGKEGAVYTGKGAIDAVDKLPPLNAKDYEIALDTKDWKIPFPRVVVAKRKEKKASLLSAILPTINERDYNAFYDKVASDRGLQAQYVFNKAATASALQTLAAYEPSSPRKLASAVLQNLKPTVAQLRKEAEGYVLKTAAHNCWLPEERALDRGAALDLFGTKTVLAADMTGSATLALGEGVSEVDSPEEDTPELATEFGVYKVQDAHGRHLIGYVFPNLIDIDGKALPISLFTNGSHMAIQGDIAGLEVGSSGSRLFEGRPRGLGAFYRVLPNGRAEATVPMTVRATIAAPEQGGVILQAETFDGRSVEVIVQPNLQKIMPSPEGDHLLVPDTFSWLPLDRAESTTLVEDPAGFNKEAQASRSLAEVYVRGNNGSFSVDGFPVEKLANADRHFLSLDDTVFLLGGLGADLDYAQKKLAEASAWSRPVSVRVGRHIKTAAGRMAEAEKRASDVLREMPLFRVDLVKEAAVIPDPAAVDTVLSLGFLNPENLGVFVSYLPALDEAQLKMCELLLAARLGLREVPVAALERAVKTTEQALEGLKVLAFQQ